MSLLIRLGVLFYGTLTMFLGCFTALYVLNLIPYGDVELIMRVVYYDPLMRGIFAIFAIAILLKNYIYMRAITGGQQYGKTIAFDNPSGRVSVSLSALEDLIRRVISRVPEVKEVRTVVGAGKKGLEVDARLVLNADVNIPEMTSKLQDLVKQKIQDTIGIEEQVTIRVDVAKIIPNLKKVNQKRNKDADPDQPIKEPKVPYHGYGA